MSPKKQAIIHLGAHKTGTTHFQATLDHNASRLAESGVTALERVKITQSITTPIRQRVQAGGPLPDSIFDEINPSSDHTLVVSDEELLGSPNLAMTGSLYPKAIEFVGELRQLLGHFHQRTWVITIRNTADFIHSTYIQRLKVGETLSGEEYLSGVNLSHIRWAEVVRSILARISGNADRLIVREYDGLNTNAPILELVLSAAPGVDELEPAPNPKPNMSYNERGAKIAIACNPLLESHEERLGLRRFLEKHFSSGHGEKFSILSSGQMEQAARLWQEDLGYMRAMHAEGLITFMPAS